MGLPNEFWRLKKRAAKILAFSHDETEIAAAKSYMQRFVLCEKHGGELMEKFNRVVAVEPGALAEDNLRVHLVGVAQTDLELEESLEFKQSLKETLAEWGWDQGLTYRFYMTSMATRAAAIAVHDKIDELKSLRITDTFVSENAQGVSIVADLRSRRPDELKDLKKELHALFPGIDLKFAPGAPPVELPAGYKVFNFGLSKPGPALAN